MEPPGKDVHPQSLSAYAIKSPKIRKHKSFRRGLRAVANQSPSSHDVQRPPGQLPTTANRVKGEQDHQTRPLENGPPANSPAIDSSTNTATLPSRPQQERKHSHGLSWTNNTADSVVDNLLLSLDRLTGPPSEHSTAGRKGLNGIGATADPQGPPMSQFSAYRTRGHAHSNSLSSEKERNESPSRVANSDSPQTRRPSALGASKLGMRGSRQESFDGQESVRPTRGWSRHGSKSSDMTNGEHSSASPSRLHAREASRERDTGTQNRDRSRSRTGRLQDSILARGRPVPSTGNPLAPSLEPSNSVGANAAPRPLYDSAMKDQRAAAPNGKQTSQSHSKLTGSPKTGGDGFDNPRGTAGDFIRASSMKNLHHTSGSATLVTGIPNNSFHKTQGQQPEEKKGFFKRVFGSSNSRSNLHNSEAANLDGSPSVSRQGSYSNIQYPAPHAATSRRDREVSPAPGSNKELTKKSSSFFRRRKKSVNESSDLPALPPPTPSFGAAADDPTQARSSLYKAMDPYLNKPRSGPTTPVQRSTGREGVPEEQRSRMAEEVLPSAEDSDDPELFHTGYEKSPDAPIRNQSTSNNDLTAATVADTISELPLRSGSIGGQNQAMQMKGRKKEKPSSISPKVASSRSDATAEGSLEKAASKGRITPDLDDTPSEQETFYTPVNDASQAPKMEARINSPDDLGLSYEEPTSVPSIQHPTQMVSPQLDHLRVERYDDPARNMSVATTATGVSSMSAILEGPTFEDREHALSIFNGDEDFMPRATAAQFLGDRKTSSVNTLRAYVELFQLNGQTILGALRMLCNRLNLKAESQQVDRILDALAARWCECNPSHGFKLKDCVHTIFYSLLLLNTDMHVAELENRMTRAQFVKNTLPLIKRIVAEAPPDAFDPADQSVRPTLQWQDSTNTVGTNDSADTVENRRSSVDSRRPTLSKRMSWSFGMGKPEEFEQHQLLANSGSNALVSENFDIKPAEWHYELESILKSFFSAIRNEPLPLNRQDRPGLRRTNSGKSIAHSIAPSEMSTRTKKSDFYSMSGRWGGRSRGRNKFYNSSTMASSRTSFDDGGSIFSTAASKFSRTLTMNTDSYGIGADQLFPQQIGFANALSQSNAREDGVEDDNMSINPQKFLLEDDSLELAGAPWAKEGILKHKHHLEASDKKAKERNWSECFAVIEKGYIRLFSFNSKGGKSGSLGVRKSMQQRGKAPSIGPSVVGGGNWMQNAESLGSFLLRQTIASTLPPPGYSKARPHVWALSLPTGAVHLFQVGTAEIAREFMNTANYWSARLSKEPLQGGVDNVEYGWGESVLAPPLINPSLIAASTGRGSSDPNTSKPPSRSGRHSIQNSISIPQGSGGPGTRASIAGSIRGSIDQNLLRARTAGDRVALEEWKPPAQSMMASQLMEVDQLQGLKDYVRSVEAELTKHNDLRGQMANAYTTRHPNLLKAIANWEKKSAYLLREIVKFRTYIDALNLAQEEKVKIDKDREDREAEKEDRLRKKKERLDAESKLTGEAERSGSTATDGDVKSGETSLENTPRLGNTFEPPQLTA